ncbi:MAG: class I SAM-dependent methyltransferase [Anaerolineaceae bacterium]|nr:class I SAM-dependent methyltransferase [Anaerolineaceae bacterium]
MSDYQFWSLRYKQQASWTIQTRNFIINQITLPPKANILEVGCGSSAVLDEFTELGHITFGLDNDLQILNYSNQHLPKSRLINSDGYFLPFKNNFFDLCFCHYLLLWINDPLKIIKEMSRVSKKSGWICCFAEPDYLSRIDYPSPLDKLGQMQNSSLSTQGVNLSTGRNITNWLKEVSLSNIHWGIFGSHQKVASNNFAADTEWKTIQHDLEKLYPAEEILKYKEIEQNAQNQGIRILFIPTFYAYAQKVD